MPRRQRRFKCGVGAKRRHGACTAAPPCATALDPMVRAQMPTRCIDTARAVRNGLHAFTSPAAGGRQQGRPACASRALTVPSALRTMLRGCAQVAVGAVGCGQRVGQGRHRVELEIQTQTRRHGVPYELGAAAQVFKRPRECMGTAAWRETCAELTRSRPIWIPSRHARWFAQRARTP